MTTQGLWLNDLCRPTRNSAPEKHSMSSRYFNYHSPNSSEWCACWCPGSPIPEQGCQPVSHPLATVCKAMQDICLQQVVETGAERDHPGHLPMPLPYPAPQPPALGHMTGIGQHLPQKVVLTPEAQSLLWRGLAMTSPSKHGDLGWGQMFPVGVDEALERCFLLANHHLDSSW